MTRKLGSIVILGLLFGGQLVAQTRIQGPSHDEEAKLRFAATQHEIISILIDERQFDQIPPEFKKILDLDLADETLIVREVWIIVEGLTKAKDYRLSHQLIDNALASVSETESEFNLLMLKGKVYKQQGQLKEAIQTYRLAQDLQR